LVNKIKNSKIIFPDRAHYKIEYSDELVDLISLLLKKDRKARLGFQDGVNEVMAHPFFASTIKVDLE
jgi:hypothetical protein